ncbi:class I SAM-dependent methyltransferase [Desulfobacterota bacterium AH_259_B03_O07]|nr:class I SAM-dependent methyltransferase [Desulfobacterota bacterium AH_259_B03_O07]
MKDIKKSFYENYWKKRVHTGRLHILENMWIPPRIKIAISLIEDSYEGQSLFCLDVGCGEGTFGKLMKARFGEKCFLFGIDISETALKYAKKYYQQVSQFDIESSDISKLFPSHKFDYLICLETLEHLFRPESVLKQFTKLLKIDGYLIASFPNIAWWKFRIDLLKGNFPQEYTLLHPSEHIQNFTLSSFTRLLEENGFTIRDLDGQFIPPGFLKPWKLLTPFVKKFPNLFGYQLVVKAKLK